MAGGNNVGVGVKVLVFWGVVVMVADGRSVLVMVGVAVLKAPVFDKNKVPPSRKLAMIAPIPSPYPRYLISLNCTRIF